MMEYSIYLKNGTNALATIDTIQLTRATPPPTHWMFSEDITLKENAVVQPGHSAYGRFYGVQGGLLPGQVDVTLSFQMQPSPVGPVRFKVTVGWGSTGAEPWAGSSVVSGESSLLTINPMWPLPYPLGIATWIVPIAIRERSWSERFALCVACT